MQYQTLDDDFEKIKESVSFSGTINFNVSLDSYTTYKIGGCADTFITVNDFLSLILVIKHCKNQGIPFYVIGGGSNLLISDDGFRGVVIKLSGEFKNFEFKEQENTYKVGAGCSLQSIVKHSVENGMSGIEFCAGTPGSIGGAVKVNAGSASEYIGSAVSSIDVLNKNLEVVTINRSKLIFTYRSSNIPDDCIILSANIKLNKTNSKSKVIELNNKYKEKLEFRRQNQPLNYPSCGSVFKNPKSSSAGYLIDSLGIKGMRHGGACVSEKHANFIINKKNATARDVVYIINYIQKKVYEKYKIKLLPEVKFLGFDKQVTLFN